MSPSERSPGDHKKMRLIIHAGAHKTATTSLQNWLLKVRGELLAQNIFYLDPSQINKYSLVEQFHQSTEMSAFKPANTLFRLVSELEIPQNVSQLMISHESILSYTNMLPRALQQHGFYGSLESSAACIRALCEEFDITIVFYVRRQDQFIASVYLQYVMRGNIYVDFRKYIKRIGGFKSCSWLSLLERMRTSLPEADIRVRPFEIIKEGEDVFLAEYMKACDIVPTDELTQVPLPRSNESMSQAALDQLLLEGEGMNAPQRRARGQELRKQFPIGEYPKSAILSEEYSRHIRRFYKEENNDLFESWMSGYEEFRY